MTEVTTRDTSSMTKLSSVSSSTSLTSGTYSISTAEELAQLAEMTNNGLVGKDCEFVLANDIDLSGYDNWTPIGNGDFYASSTYLVIDYVFKATFDGNGYVVSNLTHTSYDNYVGLFGTVTGTVKNLGVEDCYISGAGDKVGALAGYNLGTIENCYSTGYVQGTSYVGGLVGDDYSYIDDSYSTCTVVGTGDNIGGLSGYGVGGHYISNAYYSGEVISNSAIDTKYYDPTLGGLLDRIATTSLQIGISSDSNSNLTVETGVALTNLSNLRNIGVGAGDYLSTIDDLISKVTNKQTELGAAQNRLDSALDEISTKYENLVSSRSTLLDTDVAKVTSEYIRQQILQEASATLLATANQTPSIALSLI
jgi:flagellin-like hook-associated protein FlgL